MKNISIIFLFLILWSCNTSIKEWNKDIEWDGDSMNGLTLDLLPKYTLDSIQFSNGNSNYLLKGSIRANSIIKDYQLLLSANPFTTNVCKVLTQEFPLDVSSPENFSCKIYRFDTRIGIEWKNQKERLTIYLRHPFNEEH